jgi:hypothetical protein
VTSSSECSTISFKPANPEGTKLMEVQESDDGKNFDKDHRRKIKAERKEKKENKTKKRARRKHKMELQVKLDESKLMTESLSKELNCEREAKRRLVETHSMEKTEAEEKLRLI